MKQMSSRLQIVNLHLNRFPAPENVAFSTGELIEIVIGVILHSFVTSVVNADMEPREIAYNELIGHFFSLESTITTSKPGEQASKTVKFDKETQKDDPQKQKSKDNERSDSNSNKNIASSVRRCRENSAIFGKPITLRISNLKTTALKNKV